MPGKRAKTSLELSVDVSGNRSETSTLKVLRGNERRIFSGNEGAQQIAWAFPACGESCGQSWRRGDLVEMQPRAVLRPSRSPARLAWGGTGLKPETPSRQEKVSRRSLSRENGDARRCYFIRRRSFRR